VAAYVEATNSFDLERLMATFKETSSKSPAGDEGTAIALSSGRDGKGFESDVRKAAASAATEAHMTGHLRRLS
jgi:hypothetical protein